MYFGAGKAADNADDLEAIGALTLTLNWTYFLFGKAVQCSWAAAKLSTRPSATSRDRANARKINASATLVRLCQEICLEGRIPKQEHNFTSSSSTEFAVIVGLDFTAYSKEL